MARQFAKGRSMSEVAVWRQAKKHEAEVIWGPAVFVEELEPRLLLSQTPVVMPGFQLYYPAGSLDPASSTSPVGLTPDQIRHAYGIDVTKFGAISGDGTGQTIAIVDAYNDPNIVSDLQAFDSQFNLPACNLVQVGQKGGTTLPGPAPTGVSSSWGLEISLDVEWAHVVAPDATIVLVEANSNSSSDLYTAVTRPRTTPASRWSR